MRNKITLGRFYDTNSIFHKIHPFVKMISFVIYFIGILLTNHIFTCLGFLLFLFIIIYFSHIPLKVYLKSLWSMKILFLFLVIFNSIFHISFTETLLTIFQIIGIMFYSTFLCSTTKTNEITIGLEILLTPFQLFGLSPHRFAFFISLALRFIPTIFEQAEQILKSLASRGLDYHHSSFRMKIYAIKAMIIPLFALSLKSSDDFSNVLEVRLYQIDKKRSSMKEYKWGVFDIFFLVIHLFLIGIAIMKEVFSYAVFNYIFL